MDSFDENETVFDLSEEISFAEFIETTNFSIDLFDFLYDSAGSFTDVRFVNDEKKLYSGQHILSAINTIKSITACCKLGNFSDANLLLRKLFDDLMQFLYFIEVSKKYKENKFEGIDITTNGEIDYEKVKKEVFKQMKNMENGIDKGRDDKAVDKWYLEAIKSVEEFQFRLYKKYLMENADIKEFFTRFNINDLWLALRKRLNNFAHNNGIYYTDANNTSIYAFELSKDLLEQVCKDTADVISYFLVLLIILKPESIRSAEMLGYLDAGLKPPEDSQYWVASIVQDFLDKYVADVNAGIKDFLKELYCMQIE